MISKLDASVVQSMCSQGASGAVEMFRPPSTKAGFDAVQRVEAVPNGSLSMFPSRLPGRRPAASVCALIQQ